MKQWAYGLTADEWFQIASNGEDSEVAPCCGNIGQIRDLIRELMMFQSEDDSGWRVSIGKPLLQAVEADGDGHDLSSRENFPLFNRMLDGVREEQNGARK
jgi:hypothetical protein